MSDSFEMLVDADVPSEEASALSGRILNRFREIGLIASDLTDDCVLGGAGYRPGAALADLYVLGEREGKFWKGGVCGVEPSVERYFNDWALGPGLRRADMHHMSATLQDCME
jgi:hypothetical protein